MKKHTFGVAVVSAVLGLLVALGAAAANGRDFAGFYQLGDIVDLGDQVSVPMNVQIYNYSGADVIAGQIVLEDSLPPGDDLGSFAAAVDIPDRGSVSASDTFTVPRAEYDRWQAGSSPRLRLDYTDAAGETHRAPVELVPMLVNEEGQ